MNEVCFLSQVMPDSPGTISDKPPAAEAARPVTIPRWIGAFAAIVVLMIFTSIRQPTFLRWQNLINIADEQSSVGILAVGMTAVIILGGIDLSVGSLMALSGGLGVLTLNSVGANHSDFKAVLAAIVVTLVVGFTAGWINGMLIAKGRLAPFIATLGALVAFRSAGGWIANGGQFFSHGSDLFALIGRGIAIPNTNISRNIRHKIPFEFPYAILVWLVVALLGAIIINRTRLGRYIIAVGNNERAARYSAIAVDRVKIITYSLMGLLVGIAAVMEAARYTSVNSASTGSLKELDAIAAAVIGGTRMEGGSGSIFGAVIGALLLGVIRNVIVMLGINSQAQGLVMGLIIIAAALVQRGKAA